MKKNRDSRNLILQMAIGKGCIYNNILTIRDCEDHLDYLEWKKKVLQSYGYKCLDIILIENNKYKLYELKTVSSNSIISVYFSLKKFTEKTAKRINSLGLAILYMDNGSIYNKKNCSILTINTKMSKKQNQILIDYIKKEFNICFYQRKMKNKYALVCKTKEIKKFIKIIEPFVKNIDSMKYKLNINKYSNED